MHLGIDEQTLENRAAEFTSSGVGDAPMLPGLLNQIPPEQEIALFEYINSFYNPRRRHLALGWKSPVAFEQKAA